MSAEGAPLETRPAAPPPAGAGPSRAAAIFGMLLTFMGGYFLGVIRTGGRETADRETASAARVSVPVGSSPGRGAENPLVTIVEFADFECGYCSRSVALQKRLLAEFPETVRWVYKNFPLEIHPQAKQAARASLAAHAQGRFWEYHDRLFADQKRLSTNDLVALARELNLDMVRFRTELDGRVLSSLVEDDLALGRQAGVQGTPTFFINGRFVEGALAYPRLEQLVRNELAWAGQLVKRGVPRDRIYDELTRPAQAPASQPAAAPQSDRQLPQVSPGRRDPTPARSVGPRG